MILSRLLAHYVFEATKHARFDVFNLTAKRTRQDFTVHSDAHLLSIFVFPVDELILYMFDTVVGSI